MARDLLEPGKHVNEDPNAMSHRPSPARARAVKRFWAAAAALAGASAQAQPDAEEQGLEPEAVGAVAVCAVCHGPEGGGRSSLAAPRIGGLPAWYVERQLENFRSGVRGGTTEDIYGTQMHAIALTLEGPEVIAGVADHIASLTPAWPEQTVSGDVERGERLYQVCAACHGERARGSEELNTPTLVGQSDWYLLRQLQYFHSGLRGSNQADTFGRQMQPIMPMFEGREDFIDIVAYINSLSEAPAPEDAPEDVPDAAGAAQRGE